MVQNGIGDNMYRVTTPTHTFTLPDAANTYSVIQIAYRQKSVNLVKQYEDGTAPSGMELDGNNVIIMLTQEETKQFSAGSAKVQVRVLTAQGEALASKIFTISIDDVINEEVLD